MSDFEAQLTASVERSAEDLERAERTSCWLWSRRYQDKGIGLDLLPIEPSRPYSHGRRFIPAWLAAERERCMGIEHSELLGHSIWHDVGCIMQDDDPTVIWHWTNCT